MINRQILVVKEKNEKIRGWKKTRPPFFCRGAGRIHPLLSPSLLLPTTLPCQNINCNLYSDLETILSSAWHWHRTHPNGYDQ
ncbi:hypothetical protein [Aneurinibacillus migulanus]|uniref:hypothetical protein n=1 Tax=Aneurinibacillus migulanus TaxID=47500 RepID=UPI001F42211A|nr:hypothetical protein [Aneurinibacillus migulanus]